MSNPIILQTIPLKRGKLTLENTSQGLVWKRNGVIIKDLNKYSYYDPRTKKHEKLVIPKDIYRGRLAIRNDKGQLFPKRLRKNKTATSHKSTMVENESSKRLVEFQKERGSDPKFDIPFIPEKAIILNNSTTSTNVLDSLAKYAGMHNRNPKLANNTIFTRNQYKSPRPVNKDEMVGLASQETNFGAHLFRNTGLDDKFSDREIANSNYFTAYGYVPADNIIRNFQYGTNEENKTVPPLLDAFRYYAQGDYNRKDPNHTSDVNERGKQLWKNKKVQDWWNASGQYWYNKGLKGK